MRGENFIFFLASSGFFVGELNKESNKKFIAYAGSDRVESYKRFIKYLENNIVVQWSH